MRARLKSLEDIPEKYKCCIREVEAMTPFLEKEVALGKSFNGKETCPWCGVVQLGVKFWVIKPWEGFGLFADLLDIDEGALGAEDAG